ncbi:YacL family protein [Aliiglaciecola sp. 3_MG-2023]|uniref:UPF0231 family protein n=1 Tax=Aliiglaciecola sp. 3_MG-2023 TaxID=3062644 RepID=UPI0026E32380|nr:YacL family protein [Aliiglaciecola sp. 3_MG-2023]MDO6693847.1 YacL family protein [Aliiglaciecola sp. 3_MG-2023]
MNYQFIRNLQGEPEAQFEMGHEAFSRWFTEELGTREDNISALFTAIDALQKHQMKGYLLEGKEFNLRLDCDEVEVRSKDLDMDGPDELPEGTELYDQESVSGCGLDDFIQVLSSWRDFVCGQ